VKELSSAASSFDRKKKKKRVGGKANQTHGHNQKKKKPEKGRRLIDRSGSIKPCQRRRPRCSNYPSARAFSASFIQIDAALFIQNIVRPGRYSVPEGPRIRRQITVDFAGKKGRGWGCFGLKTIFFHQPTHDSRVCGGGWTTGAHSGRGGDPKSEKGPVPLTGGRPSPWLEGPALQTPAFCFFQ